MAEQQNTGPGGYYILPSTAEETRRLERQARLYGGLDFLEPFVRQRPERILDVGCGSGHFTRQVASLAQGRSERFDEDLVQAAYRELEPGSDDQFLIETTVVAHGTKGAGRGATPTAPAPKGDRGSAPG